MQKKSKEPKTGLAFPIAIFYRKQRRLPRNIDAQDEIFG
jgi:hypothetical protein